MRVLVFGRTGQVARALGRSSDCTCLGRDAADLTRPEDCAEIIAGTDADVVVNAAAYTAVDAAETDAQTAHVVNAAAPAAMAQACAARGLPFIHISTDYVFDGSGETPRTEEDVTGPLGVYGQTKLDGEIAVRGAAGPHAILRTSWVVSAHGSNFVKTMLRLGSEREALTIVADQIGGPTPAQDIAAAVMEIASQLRTDPQKTGTYHFSGAPDVSWAAFAREIFAQSGTLCQVTDIPTSDYPTPARRPLNSRLDCSKITTVFGLSRPDWRVGLAQILTDLKETSQ